MTNLKEITKNGWHPAKKESWRGDFKGINQVAGWMGKGKNPTDEAKEHQSAPISSLRDPATFAPPPKHSHFYGTAGSSSAQTSGAVGLGAPVSRSDLEAREADLSAAADEASKPAPPSLPYRVNTTGISTSSLPKPPVRRVDIGQALDGKTSPRPKPGLPPRLPPRGNSQTESIQPPPYQKTNTSSAEPSRQSGYLNQNALQSLGRAGVSVPAFGIGKPSTSPSPTPTRPTDSSQTPSSSLSSMAGKLPGRQGLMLAGSISSSTSAPGADPGVTAGQKQAAWRTAQAMKDGKSSVSLSDIRDTAAVANNINQRHGAQISQGVKSAQQINQTYGITDHVNQSVVAPESPMHRVTSSPTQSGAAIVKKRPPPAPPKKIGIVPSTGSSATPPPIPLATKPK